MEGQKLSFTDIFTMLRYHVNKEITTMQLNTEQHYLIQQEFIRWLFSKYFIEHFKLCGKGHKYAEQITTDALLKLLNVYISEWGFSDITKQDNAWKWFCDNIIFCTKRSFYVIRIYSSIRS